jgi:hypothetical protein
LSINKKIIVIENLKIIGKSDKLKLKMTESKQIEKKSKINFEKKLKTILFLLSEINNIIVIKIKTSLIVK